MHILVLITGEYGLRHVRNLNTHAPLKWTISTWQAPSVLPVIMERPEDYLPLSLPPAHLLLSLAEAPGVADLIPAVARATGAQAVIAPIDNPEWLSFERARFLIEQCAEIGVTCVAPMPFCTLTETHVNIGAEQMSYDHPLIRTFARYFGRPEFEIDVNEETGCITRVRVTRDAGCGCARHVAHKLTTSPLRKAIYRTERFHRCYPCQASPRLDMVYGDTLMRVSSIIMENAIRDGVGDKVDGLPSKRC